MVEDRSRRGRKGRADELEMDGIDAKEGSLAGSWEKERAELIVDVPVWSPGCYRSTSLWSSDSLTP
jgi:hypothetical protein